MKAVIHDDNTGDKLGTITYQKGEDGSYSTSDGRKIAAKTDEEAALMIAGNLPNMKGFDLTAKVVQ
jgi:hypothetical protein